MPNDLSTLNGALLEMKDQLIYELGEKGVTASYSSSDGLLGLIGKISEIQQGGGSCYHIEFSEDSYVAFGGTATLKIMLQENYAPKVGATVTVTGSGSSVYTGITDNTGLATVTVNVNSETTFTASYSNVSATCTVVVQSSYLFWDEVTSDRSGEYRNESLQSSTKTGYLSMSYNSNGYYTIQASNDEGNHYGKFIPILDGEDNIRFSCEVASNVNNSGNRFGIVVGTDNYKNERYQISNGNLEHQTFSGTTETLLDTQHLGLSANTWYKMEFVVQGTSYTFTLYDMSDNVLYTTSSTFQSNVITSSSTKKYGLYYLNYYSSGQKRYRNIRAESL